MNSAWGPQLDGMALAQSIIEYIHEHWSQDSLCDHYHELTLPFLGLVLKHLAHGYAWAKMVRLPLHKIETRPADKSHGIRQAARFAGIAFKEVKKWLNQLESQVVRKSTSVSIKECCQWANVSLWWKRRESYPSRIRWSRCLQYAPMQAMNLFVRAER